jgi:drug/metabolite transporter (DMT)-like permease
LLIGPQNIHADSNLDKTGTVVLLLSAVSWAAGSLYSRYGPHPASPIMATALQTITGSIMLLIVAAFTGEFARFELTQVSPPSWIAYFYLMIFGSLAYMAYIWVLKVSTPARAATHAYVNPIVAVLLGWLIAGEVITSRILLSAAIIVASVTLITIYNPGEKRSSR